MSACWAARCKGLWRVQEVGESTPKASAISPNSAFGRRPSAAISELEPLAEVEGEGDAGLSEDPDAPEKGMPPLTKEFGMRWPEGDGVGCPPHFCAMACAIALAAGSVCVIFCCTLL